MEHKSNETDHIEFAFLKHMNSTNLEFKNDEEYSKRLEIYTNNNNYIIKNNA